MKFEEALQAMRAGKKVKRKDTAFAIKINSQNEIVWDREGEIPPHISVESIMSEDWLIVE